MREFFLLCCLLFSVITNYAQNEWFISFGKTTDEVKNYLSSKDYFRLIKEDPEMGRVLAILDEGNQVEYVFQADKLFATSMRKEYASKTEAKVRMQNCLEYMDAISKEDVVRSTDGPTICYTASAKKRIVKLFVMNDASSKDGAQVLQLTAISSAHADKIGDNKFYTDIGLMAKPVTLGNDKSSITAENKMD